MEDQLDNITITTTNTTTTPKPNLRGIDLSINTNVGPNVSYASHAINTSNNTPPLMPIPARLRIPTTPTSTTPPSPSFHGRAPSSPSFHARVAPSSPSLHAKAAPPSPVRTPTTLTAPSTPTFFLSDASPDNNFLRSPHQPSPLIHRSMAKRFNVGGGGGADIMEDDAVDEDGVVHGVGEDDNVHNELIFTSEDIFVIPPTLSIDEKLFHDEVILWSHYVKINTTLRQSQTIFNIIFFAVFFITTIVLAYSANKYISTRAAIVTLWCMAPIALFSGFIFIRLLFEHTCFFITNYRIIQCRLLGARLNTKSMSYPSITDIRIAKDAISFFARHKYPFIKFIGVDNTNSINKILQQQRANPSQVGSLDSPQSLDKQHIPEKYGEFIQQSELPFLEVNHAPSIAGKYMKGTIKFLVAFLWVGVILLLLKASVTWMVVYFLSILLLPIIFLLANTLDKVDVLSSRGLVFLRVGLAYLHGCRYGRNALRLGYENAYPLSSSYNIKTNQGTISFYNYTFANINSDDVIATEEILYHKYVEALSN